MSYDIKMKATYKNVTVRFNMPRVGKTVDLDFCGNAMIQAINKKQEDFTCKMELTGLAIDGRGDPIEVKQNEVSFTEETK